MTHPFDRFLWFLLLLPMIFVTPGFAEDSENSRATLAGIQGVGVIVEELQPNVQKYAAKSGLTKMQLQKDIEQKLRGGGIRVVAGGDWINTPGKPMLYVNVNTHETEKYWYAYNIKVELRQMASLEVNPKVRTLASTWSMTMTGVANIGNLNIIRGDLGVLMGRFVQAYHAVNKVK